MLIDRQGTKWELSLDGYQEYLNNNAHHGESPLGNYLREFSPARFELAFRQWIREAHREGRIERADQ